MSLADDDLKIIFFSLSCKLEWLDTPKKIINSLAIEVSYEVKFCSTLGYWDD